MSASASAEGAAALPAVHAQLHVAQACAATCIGGRRPGASAGVGETRCALPPPDRPALRAELRPLTSGYAPCPTGVALFPREILKPPRAWAASAYKLVHWSEMSHGGHFAALEQPALLAEDVVKFIDLVKANGWI